MSDGSLVQQELPGFSPLFLFALEHGYDYVDCVLLHMAFDENLLLTHKGCHAAYKFFSSMPIDRAIAFVHMITYGLNPMEAGIVEGRGFRRMAWGTEYNATR